jgi:hypothetical protein
VGYRGGYGAFLGGIKGVGGWPCSCERVVGTPFFSQEIENINILGYFGHFVAQKVTKYSKIAQNSLLESFKVF